MTVPKPTVEVLDNGNHGYIALRWEHDDYEHGVSMNWQSTGPFTSREPLVAMQKCIDEFVNWCNEVLDVGE